MIRLMDCSASGEVAFPRELMSEAVSIFGSCCYASIIKRVRGVAKIELVEESDAEYVIFVQI
jgi:hypothetical protein